MASNLPATVQRPGLPAAPAQQPTGETAAMVLAAQAKALVSARFEIAIRQPRDPEQVRQRLMRECERSSFAAVAIYRLPRGKNDDGSKKFIEGPSIRFAEAAISAMGNLAVETPAIYDDNEKRIIRVTVADMETNVVHSKDVTVVKRVERSFLKDGEAAIKTRINSYGKPVHLVEATDDEILNRENALVSKALRTTGMRLVPGWLVDECMSAIRSTLRAESAQNPDAAKRKLLDAFFDVGVGAAQIKEWLGHPPDVLQPAELEELRGIYTAIRDGDATWREVMDAKWQEQIGAMDGNATAAATGTRTDKLKDKVRQKAAQASAPAAAPAPVGEPPLSCGVCGEPKKLDADGLCADCAMPEGGEDRGTNP